ncbi:hypothetical protein VTN00DRAFT_5883 [Thermoascus crustaceus]|uniref:uncharacterized protein n=1 Tax=Thermoascus crustaceus TaxID=5088 RepID=UPI00374380E3
MWWISRRTLSRIVQRVLILPGLEEGKKCVSASGVAEKRCGLHVHVREDGSVMGVARVKRVGVVPDKGVHEPRRAVFQPVVGASRLVSVQETPLVTTPGEPTPSGTGRLNSHVYAARPSIPQNARDVQIILFAHVSGDRQWLRSIQPTGSIVGSSEFHTHFAPGPYGPLPSVTRLGGYHARDTALWTALTALVPSRLLLPTTRPFVARLRDRIVVSPPLSPLLPLPRPRTERVRYLRSAVVGSANLAAGGLNVVSVVVFSVLSRHPQSESGLIVRDDS